MAFATISFRAPRPTDSTGNAVNEGCAVPVMKGRQTLSLRREIARLDEDLQTLSETPCSFWACCGPKRPLPMVTCGKCQVMRSLASLRATLARQLEGRERSTR